MRLARAEIWAVGTDQETMLPVGKMKTSPYDAESSDIMGWLESGRRRWRTWSASPVLVGSIM